MLRRFRFNLPQRIAAALLALFLLQGFWLTSRQTLSDRDYQYARCGREMWEKPSPLAGYYTSCGNIHDGILAYRLAGLPLTLNLLAERGLDRFRQPEIRVVQEPGSELSTWELRHQMTHILLLLRLPFLFAGCLLGGCLWWVTRRLYGNLGGYTALASTAFPPQFCAPASRPIPRFWLRWGCLAVCTPALAWPTPCRAQAQVAAADHPAHDDLWTGGGGAYCSVPVAALLGLAAMLWVAEGYRSQTLPVVLAGAVARCAGVCLLRIFARRGQLSVSLIRGIPVGFNGSGAAVFQHGRQRRRDRGGLCSRRAVSGNTQIALLRQHSSAVLRFGFDGAGDDPGSRESMALVVALSVHLRGRRVR